MVDRTWDTVITDTARSPLKPCENAGSHIAGQLELDRTSRLLLNDHCPGLNLPTCDEGASLDLDQLASAELAVDREIERRTVSSLSFPIQEEMDRPDLLLRQGSLGPHGLAGIHAARSRAPASCREYPLSVLLRP